MHLLFHGLLPVFLLYVWFQSTLICDIKEQGIVTLNILRIVTRLPEILVEELLKDQKKFKKAESQPSTTKFIKVRKKTAK